MIYIILLVALLYIYLGIRFVFWHVKVAKAEGKIISFKLLKFYLVEIIMIWMLWGVIFWITNFSKVGF